MGLLDHSTNNIIVDAVLTKKGRQSLAKNDGSFTISHFSLSDDEVNYEIIKQFGRTVGKEKIEKNTPVFEALTAGTMASRHRLITVNQQLTHYPTLSIEATNYTSSTNILQLRTSTNNSLTTLKTAANLEYLIQMTSGYTLPNSFSEGMWTIEVDSNLLTVGSGGARGRTLLQYTDVSDKRAVYKKVARVSSDTTNASQLNFKLNVKDTISTSSAQFDLYKVSGQEFIRTYVRVASVQTGLVKILEVKIYGTSASSV